MHESIVFCSVRDVGLRCRSKESSRSLSHLLMSFSYKTTSISKRKTDVFIAIVLTFEVFLLELLIFVPGMLFIYLCYFLF